MIEDEVYKQMDISNPCYYKDYFDFDRYKRDIIQSSLNNVLDNDGSNVNQRVWENFSDTLTNKLNGVIRRYYNKVIKENCRDRW